MTKRLVAAALAALIVGAAAPAEPERHALAITMPDTVNLAADVILPVARPAPAILVMTPYGRRSRLGKGAIGAFTAAGFALVFVDTRGTGASQGHIDMVFSPEERGDIAAILSWIAAQPWSNKRVVTTGVSYDANLAALAVASGSPVVVGAVPRFIDFDTYRDLAVPGGVRNEMLLRQWGALTGALNSGGPCLIDASRCAAMENLAPLDGDTDFSLLRAALHDHQKDWNATVGTARYDFEDDLVPSGRPLRDGFLSSQVARLRASPVPVQLWGSWFDAATADSALAWYAAAPSAPISLYLGAWTHGGGQRVDPFLPSPAEDEPGAPVPPQVFLDFAQRAASGTGTPARGITYYTGGAAVWRKTEAWPPAGIVPVRRYLGAQNTLRDRADGVNGTDIYRTDYDASTGTTNRWTTQMGGGPVAYGDRAAADRHLLTYTSAPLDHAIEVTGAATVGLRLASTHPDGAVFAYLEAVSPEGKVIYLSEGDLRLALRGGADPFSPSFLRADTSLLTPDRAIEIAIRLHNVSAVVPKGYRLRLALAGADRDTFGRYPPDGDPTWTLFRATSYIDIPQAAWTR
ncbi:MAG: CocE/NonD family hydrolase [Rhizomicrobium sp.]